MTANPLSGQNVATHEILPFDDELVNFSFGFAEILGCSKALLLHHIWVTFAHHYQNPENARFERPDRPGEGEKTWIYFTLETMAIHVPLTTRAIITALKELESAGWIEVWRQKGKRTLYRPSIARFCLSSTYRRKGAQFEREPDRYAKPDQSPWTSEETSHDKVVTGAVSSLAPVKKLHTNEGRNFTRSHIPREPREEPRLKNSSARPNAREGFDETRDLDRVPAGEEGTGDDPGAWQDDMSHDERVEAAARAYLEQPMGKLQLVRLLARFQVTMEDVRVRVAEIQAAGRGKPPATPSEEGGVDDDKGMAYRSV